MSEQDEEKHVTVVKNATDLQRLKLEKLMKNPDKLAFIPERPREKKFSDPAEFVRNVMGSSAGAGSGEFHVYRHIRRREYARQEFLQHCKEKEILDEEYHCKLDDNRKALEDKAAKKRAKRHRHKERLKAKRQKLKELKKKGLPLPKSSSSSEEESSEEEDTNDNVSPPRCDIQQGEKKCQETSTGVGDKNSEEKADEGEKSLEKNDQPEEKLYEDKGEKLVEKTEQFEEKVNQDNLEKVVENNEQKKCDSVEAKED